MPHIDLEPGVPGIRAAMQFRPETAKPLLELAEALLRADNTLGRGERELIASYVSHLNRCRFCHASHRAFAGAQLEEGATLVDQVAADLETAPVSEKLRSLLRIAAKVAEGGLSVLPADVERARGEGATDVEIHDTVLIAAAFCMFNRYVDGLATWAPDDEAAYEAMAERIVTQGYLAPARP
ncbi:MAG: peroxidase-related enzyme [Gaiellales bacterium]